MTGIASSMSTVTIRGPTSRSTGLPAGNSPRRSMAMAWTHGAGRDACLLRRRERVWFGDPRPDVVRAGQLTSVAQEPLHLAR